MIRKTALLTAAAGLMFAAPAFAQDAATPATTQTPPAAAAPAQPASLQLQPGSDVKGSDGTVLGKLEGVRTNDAGEQELTVRGADGQLRGVPLGGLKQEGAGVVVGWSAAEYQAAPAIAGAAPAAAPAASPTPAPTDGTTNEPSEDEETEATPPPTEPQA